MGTRRERWSWAVALCVGAQLWAAGPVLGQQDAGGLEIFASNLENLERVVQRLSGEYANPVASMRSHPIETRLIEARVMYELGNFEAASILFSALIDAPDFRSHSDFYPATMYLARSMLELRDYRGAQKHLERVSEGPDVGLQEEARYLLVEMALDAGEATTLREIVQAVTRVSSARTRYALGKAWLRLGDLNRATRLLQAVDAASPYFHRARYYLGVAYTTAVQYDVALVEFENLSRLKPETPDAAKVRDLALLASGRLRLEMGDLDGAITRYQRLDRNSESYEVALYEMAFAFIKREQYDKALQTVDVLLLTVKDPQLEVEAHVLRGRLNIFLDRYRDAIDSYEQIVDTFAPIRNELNVFTREPENIQRYFAWLLERDTADASLKAPLTERTATWVESTEDMDRVGRVFAAISAQRQDVRELDELAQDLERIVSSKNRVELFPELQEGWTRALAAENRLLTLSTAMLDAQYERARGFVVGEAREQIDSMVTWRHRLEQKLAGIPMSYGQYRQRKAEVNEQFLDLQRKSFLVGQNLEELKRQFLALEGYINELEFSDGAQALTEARARELRAELDRERQRLSALMADVRRVEKSISIEASRVGTGDTITEGETDLKGSLIQAHKREGLLYVQLGIGPLMDQQTLDTFGLFRERIWAAMQRLSAVVGVIDQRVGQKTRELQKTIRVEHRRIADYSEQVSSYHQESRDVAQVLGESIFNRARKDMNDVVLEADVGLLDVSWEQKRSRTVEIRRLNEARARKLRKLEGDLRALTLELDAPEDDAGRSAQ